MARNDANAEFKDESTKQKEYVEKRKASGKRQHGLIVADAFIRSIRDLGYKSPATALDELVDNCIQANATTTEIVFGYADLKKKGSPNQIAIADDGHGMIPEMIRYAVMWGGTHREGDRSGFGRYGYGLPSAAVSLAKRYTVYSKPSGGKWHAVTIDLDELALKAEAGEDIEVPPFLQAEPPGFVTTGAKKIELGKLEHGTVVVLEDLDRLPSGWTQTATLRKKLLSHFGVVYRRLLPEPRLFVDREKVQAVDPLFLMEAGRFYDENVLMAQAVKMKDFEVETPSGRIGFVRIRAALLPANFQAEDPNVIPKRARNNSRFAILKEYNGLLICRAGRQIDCLGSIPWATFVNYDRNIKIEIDFDPALDEFFGLTTSKQQITIEEGMWARLDAAGVRKLIVDLRKKFRESLAELEELLAIGVDEQEEVRPSEDAMADSAKVAPPPVTPSPAKVAKAKENLQKEASQVSKQTGKPLEKALEEIKRQTEEHPFKVEFKSLPEGPFYRPDRVGKQKRLIINTAHRFYTDVYAAPDSKPGTKSALEVLLFVLADGELEVEGEFEDFYRTARMNWSMRLHNALKRLDPNGTLVDKASAMAEDLEVANAEKRGATDGERVVKSTTV